MPHIVSQSDCLLQVVDKNSYTLFLLSANQIAWSHTEWQTVQIQISWLLRLLKESTDLDLLCLQRKGLSGFSKTRVKTMFFTCRLIDICVNYFCLSCDWWLKMIRTCYIAPSKVLLFNQKVLIFFLFLHECICCGYSLEAPCRGILMSTHNICFHEEIRKTFTCTLWYAILCRAMFYFICTNIPPTEREIFAVQVGTPQPLYNTLVGVHSINCVS